MRYYTGIGSRQTPENIQTIMTNLAQSLSKKGMSLRSGGAQGADQAFEDGVVSPELKQIFLPWKGFNGKYVKTQGYILSDDLPSGILETAFQIAERYHPNWEACSNGAKKLHSRNVFQVFGPDLWTFSEFVICWTPNGSGSGGTGQAIRMAKSSGIPVFDLGDEKDHDRLEQYLRSRNLW